MNRREPGPPSLSYRVSTSTGFGYRRAVEEGILGLLAEGALATEQIAAQLRVAEATVRVTLEVLRDGGLVGVAAIAQLNGVTGNGAAYWRITDAGRARLEQ